MKGDENMTKDLFSRKKNEEVTEANEALHSEKETKDVSENEAEKHNKNSDTEEVVISAKEYRRLKELEKKELERLKQNENSSQSQNANTNTDIISQWERDAAQLKFIQPEFDFRTELQSNSQFRQLISQGMGVIEAYAASRPQPQKQEPPKQAERKPIKQNAQSPDGGTGTNTRNVANMSSAEFKQYIENIRNS
jgi:hypothetical protein